jgi:hypothetical protein
MGDMVSTLTKRLWLPAAAIAVASAIVYIAIADWPPGTHIDEFKKARHIVSGEQYFLHPILMVQLPRAVNFFVGYTDPADVLRIGRTFSGIAGGLLVLATVVLGRTVLAPATALAAAAAVAVTPLVAVHATFLKEDIYVAPAIIFAMAALLALVERPTTRRALVCGILLGVAAAAKYVGAIMLPYAILVVMFACPGSLTARLRLTGMLLGPAILVFAAINASGGGSVEALATGLSKEIEHARLGHFDVKLPIWLTGGVFHLRESLLPGLGIPLLILGLLGLAAPLVNSSRRRPLAIILGAALLWYFAHEISPLKPFPNVERYMVPIVPLLVVLGASVIEMIASWRSSRVAMIAAPAAIAIFALPAAYKTYMIVMGAQHDPRGIVPQIVSSFGPQVRFDNFVAYDRDALEAAARGPGQPSGPTRVFVTSSFVYDRLARHGDDSSQPEETRKAFEFYGNLFRRPYLELSGGPQFGFLNPVVRIVAIDNDIDHLVSIGGAAIETDPYVKMTIGP